VILPARYDLQEALSERAESVTAVLAQYGSWVAMADDRHVCFIAASQASASIERDHAPLHPFPRPLREAHSTGEVVRVTDVRQESTG
jgi:hypothetical protein